MGENKEKKSMSERETMDYIESLQSLGSVPGLENIINLCHKLGDPQDKLQFIHVAGTNGKGSVCAYLASVLKADGYRVGSYNSPTIRNYRERICVNGRMISKNALSVLLTRIKCACEELVSEGKSHPTVFEVETALGFMYFVEKKCDFVLLEAGMGGLLDATNLVKSPLVAVLTPIGMDHMAFLGNTLSEIAQNKAGIIKPGSVVVSAPQREDAMCVIEKKCQLEGVSLKKVQTEEATSIHYGLQKQSFVYRGRFKIEIRLAGNYQIENALLALRVVEAIQEKGIKITEKAITSGFREALWPGRFEVLARNPYFIVDGAHNEDGAARLAQTIQFYFTNKKIIYIMGILKDKEYEKIIRKTCPFAESIITVKTPDNPRAMDAYELACRVAEHHASVTAAGSIEEAVEMSYLLADKDSVIIAFGSLSYLGAVMDILEKKQRKK